MICSLHDRQFAFSLSLIEGAYHSAWPLSYEGKLSIEPKSFTMSIPLQHPKESHYAQQDYTEDKSLYSGLSWVLQGRGYEEDDANDARQKRMAIDIIPPLIYTLIVVYLFSLDKSSGTMHIFFRANLCCTITTPQNEHPKATRRRDDLANNVQ